MGSIVDVMFFNISCMIDSYLFASILPHKLLPTVAYLHVLPFTCVENDRTPFVQLTESNPVLGIYWLKMHGKDTLLKIRPP